MANRSETGFYYTEFCICASSTIIDGLFPAHHREHGTFRQLLAPMGLRNELYLMCYVFNRNLMAGFMGIQEVRRRKSKNRLQKAPYRRKKSSALISRPHNTLNTVVFSNRASPVPVPLLQTLGILHTPERLRCK